MSILCCKRCGEKIEVREGEKIVFCPKCGSKVDFQIKEENRNENVTRNENVSRNENVTRNEIRTQETAVKRSKAGIVIAVLIAIVAVMAVTIAVFCVKLSEKKAEDSTAEPDATVVVDSDEEFVPTNEQEPDVTPFYEKEDSENAHSSDDTQDKSHEEEHEPGEKTPGAIRDLHDELKCGTGVDALSDAFDEAGYSSFAETVGEGYKHIYIPDDSGNLTGYGTAVYYVDYPQFDELEAYGNVFVYHGDFADGLRHGYGVWIAINGERFYRFEGNWENDNPDGYGEIREWNEGIYTNMNSQRVRVISGNLTDGIWEGTVNWNFEYSNGEKRENSFNFENGNTRTRYNANRPAYPYMIVDSDGLLGFPIDVSVIKCGVLGFDEVGSRILIYPANN